MKLLDEIMSTSHHHQNSDAQEMHNSLLHNTLRGNYIDDHMIFNSIILHLMVMLHEIIYKLHFITNLNK